MRVKDIERELVVVGAFARLVRGATGRRLVRLLHVVAAIAALDDESLRLLVHKADGLRKDQDARRRHEEQP